MDKDGTKSGFDLPMLEAVSQVVSVPIIASGGAGGSQHILEVLKGLQRRVLWQLQFSIMVRSPSQRPKSHAGSWIGGAHLMTEVKLDFQKQGGLIPAIILDHTSKEVLMLAYLNEEAYKLTRTSGQMWYWSRSRQELWHKGATSGHYQTVKNHS